MVHPEGKVGLVLQSSPSCRAGLQAPGAGSRGGWKLLFSVSDPLHEGDAHLSVSICSQAGRRCTRHATGDTTMWQSSCWLQAQKSTPRGWTMTPRCTTQPTTGTSRLVVAGFHGSLSMTFFFSCAKQPPVKMQRFWLFCYGLLLIAL